LLDGIGQEHYSGIIFNCKFALPENNIMVEERYNIYQKLIRSSVKV